MNVDSPFHRHQAEGEDGKSNLDPFCADRLGGHLYHPPLGRSAGAQRPHAPNRVEVDDRPANSNNFHGDANGLAVNGSEQMYTGARSGQRTDSNKQSEPTKCHESRAGALQQDKKQACESNNPRPALHDIRWASIDWRVLFGQGGSPSTMLLPFDRLCSDAAKPAGKVGPLNESSLRLKICLVCRADSSVSFRFAN